MSHQWQSVRPLLDNAQALIAAGSPEAALQAVIEAVRLSGLSPDTFPALRQALSIDDLSNALEKACCVHTSDEASPMQIAQEATTMQVLRIASVVHNAQLMLPTTGPCAALPASMH